MIEAGPLPLRCTSSRRAWKGRNVVRWPMLKSVVPASRSRSGTSGRGPPDACPRAHPAQGRHPGPPGPDRGAGAAVSPRPGRVPAVRTAAPLVRDRPRRCVPDRRPAAARPDPRSATLPGQHRRPVHIQLGLILGRASIDECLVDLLKFGDQLLHLRRNAHRLATRSEWSDAPWRRPTARSSFVAYPRALWT